MKDGFVNDVKGGGVYGDLWREFLKYPKSTKRTIHSCPKRATGGCTKLGLGTNPKFFKRPDENMAGNNISERNNAGVIHWGFGVQHGAWPQ